MFPFFLSFLPVVLLPPCHKPEAPPPNTTVSPIGPLTDYQSNKTKTNRFSEKHPEAKFYKLDVDELPAVAQELGITAMPTFLFFKAGQQVQKVVGANPAAIQSAIQTLL